MTGFTHMHTAVAEAELPEQVMVVKAATEAEIITEVTAALARMALKVKMAITLRFMVAAEALVAVDPAEAAVVALSGHNRRRGAAGRRDDHAAHLRLLGD